MAVSTEMFTRLVAVQQRRTHLSGRLHRWIGLPMPGECIWYNLLPEHLQALRDTKQQKLPVWPVQVGLLFGRLSKSQGSRIQVRFATSSAEPV